MNHESFVRCTCIQQQPDIFFYQFKDKTFEDLYNGWRYTWTTANLKIWQPSYETKNVYGNSTGFLK